MKKNLYFINLRAAPMIIEFPCWNCGNTLTAPDAHVGKKLTCVNCSVVNCIRGRRLESSESSALPDLPALAPPLWETPLASPPPLRQRNSGIACGIGWILMIAGIVSLVYFFCLDVTVKPTIPPAYDHEPQFDQRLILRQLVGSLSSGLVTVAGAILVGSCTRRR